MMKIKNKLKLISVVIILTALLSGCVLGAGASLEPSPYKPDDFDNIGTVVIATDKQSYQRNTASITYTVSNESGAEVYYGMSYCIEMQRGGKWYQLPFKEDTAWIAIAHRLDSGESQSYDVELSLFKQRLSRGNYRLVKQIGEKMYAAEFSVE